VSNYPAADADDVRYPTTESETHQGDFMYGVDQYQDHPIPNGPTRETVAARAPKFIETNVKKDGK